MPYVYRTNLEKAKVFDFDGKKLKVHLKLVTEDTAVFAEKDYYKRYWIEPDFDIALDVMFAF